MNRMTNLLKQPSQDKSIAEFDLIPVKDPEVTENILNSSKSKIRSSYYRDRPYSCSVCPKRFTQKAHLVIHKRIHTGEKPYTCHICHKRFAQSSHLTVHKRVHSGEKPFFCQFCGMGFCRKPRLEAHVLQHVVKEGKQLPPEMKGSMLNGLSMVDVNSICSNTDTVDNQESLDAATQLMELSMNSSYMGKAKLEVEDKKDSLSESEIINDDKKATRRRQRKPAIVQHIQDSVKKEVYSDKEKNESQRENNCRMQLRKRIPKKASLNEEMEKELSPTPPPQPKTTLNRLVRTNNRVSLVDFTADDILQHLMSRDDVKSCKFCCIVFHDHAMYYLHKSMHDKMDIRCCNLCGKLLLDKYDFNAHFLSKHK